MQIVSPRYSIQGALYKVGFSSVFSNKLSIVCFSTGNIEYIGLTRSTISYDEYDHQWKLVDSINPNITAISRTSFRTLAIGKSFNGV